MTTPPNKLHPFVRAVLNYGTARRLFDGVHKGIIVALSGGPDSSALLVALHTLQEANLLPLPLLAAAHYHHGLRGTDADGDAAFSAALCTKLGIPCIIELGKIPKTPGKSTYETARNLRYTFLQEVAEHFTADVVATAHHANDQAETILGRILRGTGLDGLTGIPPRRELAPGLQVIRPLLGVTRAEIENFIGPTRHDPSNDSTHYTRNRIRRLLPELAAQINPNVHTALIRLAENLEADRDLLQKLTDTLWTETASLLAPGFTLLNTLPLQNAHPALRRRILLRTIHYTATESHQEETTLLTETVTRLEELLLQQTGELSNLPGGLHAHREENTLTLFFPETLSLPETYSLPLPIPGTLYLPWASLTLQSTIRPPLALPPTRRSLAVQLAYGTMVGETGNHPLIVRAAKPGERFAPLGMHGQTRLVSDILASAGFSLAERPFVPVVARTDTGTILWIIGIAQAEETRVTATTPQVLYLQAHYG